MNWLGPLLTIRPSYIRVKDVRELSPIGFIVDDDNDFVTDGDVIKLDEIIKLNFNLVGMKVVDEKNHNIGKVIDYTISEGLYLIQQLDVQPTGLKSLTSSDRLISRIQIIEINDSAIIVKNTEKNKDINLNPSLNEYINPFRKKSDEAVEETYSSNNN